MDVELLGQVGAGRGQSLTDADQLAVQVGDDHLGPEHVLQAGVAGRITRLGDRDEVGRQLAVVEQDLPGPLVEEEVVIGALDVGDGVELGGASSARATFTSSAAASPRRRSVPNQGNCWASSRL